MQHEILNLKQFANLIEKIVKNGLNEDDKTNYLVFVSEGIDLHRIYQHKLDKEVHVTTLYITKHTRNKIENINNTGNTYEYEAGYDFSFNLNKKYEKYKELRWHGTKQEEALKEIAEEIIQKVERCDEYTKEHAKEQQRQMCQGYSLFKTCTLIAIIVIGVRIAKKLCKNCQFIDAKNKVKNIFKSS